MNRKIIIPIITAITAITLIAGGCTADKTGSETAPESSVTQTTAETLDEKNAVKITLNDTTAQVSGNGAAQQDGNLVITSGGTYTFSGNLKDGSVIVDADKNDVTLIFDGVSVTSSASSAVNVVSAGKVTVSLKDGTQNTLTDTAEYSFDGEYADKEKEEPDACLFSDSDLIITGSGKLTVNGNYKNGIKSKDNLTIDSGEISVKCANNALTGSDSVTVNSGTITVNAEGDGIHSNADVIINGGTLNLQCADDAIHGDSSVTVNSGKIDITAHEGLEATVVTVNDGEITINADDDGINAAQKVDGITPAVEINGGTISITMGQGDTDAIDSNGNITINGGTIAISAQSPFDYDGKAELNGGELTVNGETVTEISNQFSAGMQGFGGREKGNMPGGENGGFRRGFENGEMPQDGSAPAFPQDGMRPGFETGESA